MSGNMTVALRLLAKRLIKAGGWLLLMATLASSVVNAEVCTVHNTGDRQQSELMALLSQDLDVRQFALDNLVGDELSGCELLVTAGEATARRVSDLDMPVVHAMISRETYQKLYHEHPRAPRSAVFSYVPPRRYFTLIEKTLPEQSEILLFGSERTEHLYPELQAEARRIGRDLNIVPYHSGMLFDNLLREHAGKDTVLLILPDANVFNRDTARAVIMAAYHRAVPLVSYSPGVVRAGGLMATYSSLTQQASALEEGIQAWKLNGHWPAEGHAAGFSVSINYQLARALRMTIPAEQVVLESMRRVESDD